MDNKKRQSGILCHITSLPGPYGIGDLGDGAYEFIDFLYEANQSLWQVLPMGPTSFGDSPYQSFSTFAGNPLLISPKELCKEGYLEKADIQDVPAFSQTAVDYGEVIDYKEALYKKAFAAFKNKADTSQKAAFKSFCNKNTGWLDDFSLFTAVKEFYIRERDETFETVEYKAFKAANKEALSKADLDDCFYGGSWNSWDDGIKSREPEAISSWSKRLSDEIEYHKFLQYEFFRQWSLLKEYAGEKGVSIIGDIPIFVAMDSTDVWANKELFCFDSHGYPTVVAGVPPDYFSETGQLWGNPLYKWAEHKKTGYKWWINRISKALESVDVLRIDHFRGFDAYWAVPYGEKTAVKGKWLDGPGQELFDAIESNIGHMPIIAEDLGIITESVDKLRNDNGFPGMRILQFAFSDTKQNPYLPHNYDTPNTVVYTGTHDNDTTLSWYEKTDEVSKDYFRRYMNVSGQNPSWDLIRLAMSSIAAWALFPIQDVMSLGSEARLNKPGTAKDNWQFRFTSQMLHTDYAKELKYYSEMYNRNYRPEKAAASDEDDNEQTDVEN